MNGPRRAKNGRASIEVSVRSQVNSGRRPFEARRILRRAPQGDGERLAAKFKPDSRALVAAIHDLLAEMP
jgi:hypothetical protein